MRRYLKIKQPQIFFADPYGSNGVVRYGVNESVLAYNSLNMQAVAIVKRGGK